MNKKLIVISVGGSLIVPQVDKIDNLFLTKLIKLLTKYQRKGFQFILVAGGGKIARHYIAAANKVRRLSSQKADWLGIATTRLNANLLKILLDKLAYPEILLEPEQIIKTKKILVAGGYKPGRSSDAMAVSLAKNYGATTVINLSNIDYVYDKDPKRHKDARKQKNLTWSDFFNIIGTQWVPGKNVPFDPTASKIAQQSKIRVVIMNGKKLNNLDRYLKTDKCLGTIIG